MRLITEKNCSAYLAEKTVKKLVSGCKRNFISEKQKSRKGKFQSAFHHRIVSEREPYIFI